MAISAQTPRARQGVSNKKKEKDPTKIPFFNFHGRVDVPMFVIILLLTAMGIVMMFSASHALSYRDYDGDSFAYVTRQCTAAGLGLGAMFVLSFFDYRWLSREFKIPFLKGKTFTFGAAAFWFSIFILALVFPFGHSNMDGGPKRWLGVGSLSFQPSDIVKFTIIIMFAVYISRNHGKMHTFFRGLALPGVMLVIPGIMLILQPHLSGFIILVAIGGVLLIIGGMRPVHLGIALGLGVLGVLALLAISDFTYFQERFQMDPLADVRDTTYQIYEAVLAIGSGGLFGVGFGNSQQKFYYLPEAQNDFVYAIICEEWGFVGGVLIILMFIIFLMRGFYIAHRANDRMGMLLAAGISFQIAFQALLNIGVNVCCVPNTGISLPFFSYGGTALTVTLAEMGLLLSVSKRAKLD